MQDLTKTSRQMLSFQVERKQLLEIDALVEKERKKILPRFSNRSAAIRYLLATGTQNYKPSLIG